MGTRVLVVAGFDPSGGAGLLLDTKMLTLLGHCVASVPTTLTLQNTKTFEDWEPLKTRLFERMLKLTLEDTPVEGVKIGMLGTQEILEITGHYLRKYRSQIRWIVLDPVLKATLHKDLFQGENFLNILKSELLPLVDVITPNIFEAETLSKRPITTTEDLREVAQYLSSFGVKIPLITGYRKGGRIYNYLMIDGKIRGFSVRELPLEFHGTGCALSSLLLGYLLLTNTPVKALRLAMRKLRKILKLRASNPLSSELQLIH